MLHNIIHATQKSKSIASASKTFDMHHDLMSRTCVTTIQIKVCCCTNQSVLLYKPKCVIVQLLYKPKCVIVQIQSYMFNFRQWCGRDVEGTGLQRLLVQIFFQGFGKQPPPPSILGWVIHHSRYEHINILYGSSNTLLSV